MYASLKYKITLEYWKYTLRVILGVTLRSADELTHLSTELNKTLDVLDFAVTNDTDLNKLRISGNLRLVSDHTPIIIEFNESFAVSQHHSAIKQLFRQCTSNNKTPDEVE